MMRRAMQVAIRQDHSLTCYGRDKLFVSKLESGSPWWSIPWALALDGTSEHVAYVRLRMRVVQSVPAWSGVTT